MNNLPAPNAVLPFLLPLLAAVVYVAGALLLKRAGELGVGPWRIAATCNFTSAIAFAPFVLFGGTLPSWTLFWQPALVALLFVAGQLLTFLALRIGDVSIATPVMGIKIIVVALLTTALLREKVEAALWVGAVLSTVAIVMLNATGGQHHERVGATILLASLAAMAYALFDILVQKWTPAWGLVLFLPVMMLFVALFTVPMLFVGGTGGTRLPRARSWLLAGALCLSLQGLLFITSIARFGEVTMANILYSSRGLWSVVAVWVVGHWFSSREQHLGTRILTYRLSGAALMMIAIVLTILSR